tara:strand:- start:138 stop:401 length:264 start_codon:yes stop_codon:yes gene_type:complete
VGQRTNGAKTRRILRTCIWNGHLDEWISAKELSLIIAKEYDTDSEGRPRLWTDVTTMQVATVLGQLERYGEVEQNRKAGKISLWRKV